MRKAVFQRQEAATLGCCWKVAFFFAWKKNSSKENEKSTIKNSLTKQIIHPGMFSCTHLQKKVFFCFFTCKTFLKSSKKIQREKEQERERTGGKRIRRKKV